MSYPTKIINIPEYNWKIECYEITERESEIIAKAVTDNDSKAILSVIAGLIKSWNCCDRNGSELPISTEGISELPQSVIKLLITNAFQVEDTIDPKQKATL